MVPARRVSFSPLTDAAFSGSEEGGLDLLASLLDNVEESEAVSKPDPSSDSRKRKAEEVERKGEKRRKVKNSCDNGGNELAVEEMRGMNSHLIVTLVCSPP